MSLSKVCEELDELAVSYFQILEELQEQRRRFEKFIKEGFLNLSKARFSMGNRAVSSLQYDSTSMCALAHVVTRDEGDCHSFEVCRTKAMKRSERKSLEGNDSGVNQSNEDNTAIRRRRPLSSSPSDGVETLTAGMDQLSTSVEEPPTGSTTTTMQRTPTDPLLWFGVLVPQPLRHGQQNFVEAVEACAVMASLQTKLEIAYTQYRNKLKLKYEIIKKMKSDGSNLNNGAISAELQENGH
ncbi:coiled-coil domain-containing protein 115-like [Lytechinus pictus]|uniref:coiled-coil domain-containing protein 115-like n=1 Tax=Lytechinus pictus TaxID=7653 RepID=UPI0030B9F5A4